MAQLRKVGRSAETGRFVSVKKAKQKKSTAIVETVKKPAPTNKKGSLTKEKPSPKGEASPTPDKRSISSTASPFGVA